MTSRTTTAVWDDALRREVWMAMGYGGCVPERRVSDAVDALAGRLLPAARLRYMYGIVPAARLAPAQVSLGEETFAVGGIIGSYLRGMDHACVFVATAGEEFDAAVGRMKEEGDILADFMADAIGSVLAEKAVSVLETELSAAGEPCSLPYSPGYCGWDIREQHKLFSLFPPQPCGIVLSDTSLMRPEKSVSGFFAMGKTLVRQPYHCEICQNQKCFKRRNASLCR